MFQAFYIKGEIEMKLEDYPSAILSFFTCIALGYDRNEINLRLKKVT